MKKQLRRLTIVGGFVAVLAVVMSLGASAKPTNTGAVKAGGTLRVGWEQSFGFNDGFDPTGEYLADAFGIYTNLLVRTLVGVHAHVRRRRQQDRSGHRHRGSDADERREDVHVPSQVGHQVRPAREPRRSRRKDFADRDAAAREPEGRRPVRVLLHRHQGLGDAYAKGKAKTISGIKTPNASTIVFNLTHPTGDFLNRMAMPAAGPLPAEVTKCFEGQPGKYGQRPDLDGRLHVQGHRHGRHLVLQGDEARRAASTALSLIDLVRNPNYSQSTDKYREELRRRGAVHRQLERDGHLEQGRGRAARSLDRARASRRRSCSKYATTPSLKPYFHLDAGDRTWYLTMNLTAAPFDDIHVRKAMNWIMDKAALVQAWGGPTIGDDREPHRPRHAVQLPARRSTSRTGPPATTAASRRRSWR